MVPLLSPLIARTAAGDAPVANVTVLVSLQDGEAPPAPPAVLDDDDNEEEEEEEEEDEEVRSEYDSSAAASASSSDASIAAAAGGASSASVVPANVNFRCSMRVRRVRASSSGVVGTAAAASPRKTRSKYGRRVATSRSSMYVANEDSRTRPSVAVLGHSL